MDGVMFMHHARLPRMRAILDDASMIAGVRMVTTAFSFQGTSEITPIPRCYVRKRRIETAIPLQVMTASFVPPRATSA